MQNSISMTSLLLAVLLAQSVVPAPPPDPGALVPLQMREVFWGDRRGHLRHQPMTFAGERPVEGADFYRAVGRNDLADEYEQNQNNARLAGAGGGLLAMLGVIGLVAAHQSQSCRADDPTCMPSDPDTMLTAISVSSLLIGGVVMIAAGGSHADPVSEEERRTLVEAHNRALESRRKLEPAATITPQHALVGVTGRF